MDIDVFQVITKLEDEGKHSTEVLEIIKQELGPAITSRAPTGKKHRLTWSPGLFTGITGYWLIAGLEPGDKTVRNSKKLPATVTELELDIPTGKKIHLRLSYEIEGGWQDVKDRVYDPLPGSLPRVVTTTDSSAATSGIHLFNIGKPRSSVSGLKQSGPVKVRGRKNVTIADLDLRSDLPDHTPQIFAEDIENLVIENCLGQGTPAQKIKGFSDSGRASWKHFMVYAKSVENLVIRFCEGFDFHHAVLLSGCRGWDIHQNTWHDSTYSDVGIFKSRAQPGGINSIHHNVMFGRFSHRNSGDRVSYLQCAGTADDPLNIDDNYCEMVNDNSPYNIGPNGGFVMLGDHGDIRPGMRQQFLSAQRNIGINAGHYLFNITGGFGNVLKDNIGVINQLNNRANRGVGLSVVNQQVYKPEYTNTDFGHGTVSGNRVSAIGRDKNGKPTDNHFFLSRDPANKHESFKIEGNELGKITVEECRQAAAPIIRGAARFDIPDTYTSER